MLDDVEAVPRVRFNDCRADPRGRLWAGTFHRDRDPGTGRALPARPRRRARDAAAGSDDLQRDRLEPRWHHDVLHRQHHAQRVAAFAYDLDTGALGEQRTFAEIDPADGLPDGLTVDAEGGVWVCLFGGGRVRRYLADGRLEQDIVLPLTNPTCPAFGGADLRTLYITTARFRLSDEQLAREPLAGAVLQLEPGVAGQLPSRFAG